MKLLMKSASYVFHPLWMPFAGTLLYFMVSPRYFPPEVFKAKVLAVSIITIFIPVAYFYLLKTLGKVSDHYLAEVKERKWPLILFLGLLFIILKYVLNRFDYPELYFYFLGIMMSTLLSLIFLLPQIKASLHLMGMGGITTFVILLSIHFNLNLIYTISFLITATGLTASSRLYLKAHTVREIALGLLLGILPQAGLAYVWL